MYHLSLKNQMNLKILSFLRYHLNLMNQKNHLHQKHHLNLQSNYRIVHFLLFLWVKQNIVLLYPHHTILLHILESELHHLL